MDLPNRGMAGMGIIVWTVDTLARETLLFGAIGFLIGGVDDLAIDLIWFWHRLRARFAPPPVIESLGDPVPGRIAIFVAAWQESAVIGAMLRRALGQIDHPDYRIYVGTYPNDKPTIEAIATVAEDDPRVRLVIGPRDGPTTKGDNLNVLWRALRNDDPDTLAVVIHDAEDVIHADELRVHAAMLARHCVVQIPVVPLIDLRSRWARLISGHYADEFGESHARQLVVRVRLGAGLPLAGVGCAIRCDALQSIAATHDAPFDAKSLTEDYEMGLRLGAIGRSMAFARVRGRDGTLVATRAFFPAGATDAVRQKARWMIGIALAGWDRIGWGRPLHLAEHWMRMRDRRAPIAILFLAVGYVGLLSWGMSAVLHTLTDTPAPAMSDGMIRLLWINAAFFGWRITLRSVTTARLHGWREGLWAVPRLFVANWIALLAVRRAFAQYVRTPSGQMPHWDKTDHVFPVEPAG